MVASVGPFLLGMQHTPVYDHDHAGLEKAMPQSDGPMLQGLVDDIVEDVLAMPRKTGRLDVVSDVAEGVPVRLSGRYFGLTDTPEGSLVPLGRTVFRDLFYNLRRDPAIADPAAKAGAALTAHLDTLIAARRAPGGAATPGVDVLGRMLEMQDQGMPGIDLTWIHTNLLGLLIGMLPLTSKVSSLALDAMFDRPALLEGAQAALRDGDDDLLWRYISEAMRFAPQTPGIFRVAASDLTIGEGSGKAYKIPKGTRILAGTQPAMFDPLVFPDANEVRTDRAPDLYFTMGYGLHACFGRVLSEQIQLPAIVKAVIGRPGVRRVGKLSWSGPFPNSLQVEFEPG
jgi:cytochrome P450